jgi:hypothetical protein
MIQEWEGRMNVGMSNSVTTAIRDSIRDTAIGKIRNTEKADRATVEQVCKMFSARWCFFFPVPSGIELFSCTCIILLYHTTTPHFST